MKAVKLYGIQDLRLEEVDIPKIEKDDEVLVKVKAAGICGSDISRYAKLGPKFKEGFTFGHEFSGQIAEVGKAVKNLKKGDRVVVCPALPCGECEYCKMGYPARCVKLEVIGAVRDGAFAEYITIPAENCLVLPDEISYEQAAMIEPGCVIPHGLYKLNMQPGDEVAVVGCGPIGLLSCIWARAFGAKKVIAIDIMPEKLDWAIKMGATDVINSKEEDAREGVLRLTNNRGCDVVIEAAGTPFTSAQVLGLGCKGGKVLYLGIPYGDINIPRELFEKIGRNELTVYGSWNAIDQGFPGKPWTTSIAFLKEGKLDYMPMVTHRFPLEEAPEVFKKIYKRDTLFGKILLLPEGVK